MNKQTYELLSILLGAYSRRFTYRELSDTLCVSTRSIRNYILAINAFLNAAGLPIVEADANGEIGFSGTFEQAQIARKQALGSTFYEYRLSPSERCTAIRLLLLSYDNFTTLTELLSWLFVSRSTLVKDIDIVEQDFLAQGVAFDEARHKGFRLDIGEEARRRMLEECIASLAENSTLATTFGAYQSLVQRLLRIEEQEKAIATALAGAEMHYGIRFDDYCFQSISLYLAIFQARTAQGGYLCEISPGARALRGGVYDEMAARMLGELAGEAAATVPEEERLYLAYKIQSCLEGSAAAEACDVVLQMTVKSFLYRLSKGLDMPLERDERLHAELAEYISSNRQGGHSGGVRSYLEAYKHQYPRIFCAVKASADTLQTMGYCTGEDEFVELLVLVLTAVERYRAQAPLLRLVVVCNSGTVTANFMTEKLQRMLPVEIKATIPLRLLPKLEAEGGFDLIISTIPLESRVPWVQISPVLTQEDLQRVQALISTLGDRPGQVSAPKCPANPAEALLIDAVALDAEAADWRQAIALAGSLLERTGKAAPAYTAAMVETVERHGPYIVFAPGIAIAHAEPPANAAYCASLVRLLRPVAFGHPQNDPVHYVLAVQSQDENAHLSSLFRLMNMMASAAFLASLDRAATEEEVWKLILDNTN